MVLAYPLGGGFAVQRQRNGSAGGHLAVARIKHRVQQGMECWHIYSVAQHPAPRRRMRHGGT
jgi:hypothetical protein